MSQEPSTSILAVDTPSWSEIDGILSDKYRSDSDPAPAIPTQSTQDTIVQLPLNSTPYQRRDLESTPTGETAPSHYYSQPQFRERSPGLEGVFRPTSSLPPRSISTPPRLVATPPPGISTSRLSSSTDSFASSQLERVARLRRELQEEESRVLARSAELATTARRQAESALRVPDVSMAGLDSSQQLSHSILDEESRTRLELARPPSTHSESGGGGTLNSVSVDITPLTEDLLMNSRTERPIQSDAPTLSDGQFPLDEEDIIFTPLSEDDDFTKAFVTPPRVARKLEKKVHKPAVRKSKVALQSDGKLIGNTELGSFDETSSLSIIDKDSHLGRFKDSVKPLRRHAWSDSETENSLSRSLNKQQFDEIKGKSAVLSTHEERISTDLYRTPARGPAPVLSEERPRSAFAVLSPHEGRYRPFTAPSSEKRDKFGSPLNGNTGYLEEPERVESPIETRRLLEEPQKIEPKTSETSLDSADYPNLKSSFMSLQNTIMSDIAALRRDIVEKQVGTERLRSEFSEFKHAYYKSVLDIQQEKAAAQQQEQSAKRKQDAVIQTSQPLDSYPTPQPPPIEEKENKAPVPPPETSYSSCDSETDRQLATLRALQRSLRDQTNERYLLDMEERRAVKTARSHAGMVETARSHAGMVETARSHAGMVETARSHAGMVDRMIQSSPTSARMVDRMMQSSPAHLSSRSIQTTARLKIDADVNTSDVDPPREKSPAPPRERFRDTATSGRTQVSGSPSPTGRSLKTPIPKPYPSSQSGDSSLNSNQQATRELFMDILRRKAEEDESEKIEKRTENLRSSFKQKQDRSKKIPTSTPKPGRVAGRSTYTPASIISDDSTLTEGTCVVGEDVEALNALWSQFMKFVVQSKALKHRKSGATRAERKPGFSVDVERLEALNETFSKETKVGTSGVRRGKSPEKKEKRRVKTPVEFDLSAGDLKKRTGGDDSYRIEKSAGRSAGSREDRINRLINEIEEERRKRKDKVIFEEVQRDIASQRVRKEEMPAELDSVPVREEELVTPIPAPPSPPRSPVAFDIGFDDFASSITSEEVDRAPGYPNMVFKTGKLQDAFITHKQLFLKKSRRRALQIQLCKESRQRYGNMTPPQRPRPTVDPKYFTAFDIPRPRTRVISHKEMTKHSKKIYNRLEEQERKRHEGKVARQRDTYRLRAQLFNKKVQETVLGKKYMNSVRVY